MDRFARFSWITLAYTLAVILWGAMVRATGSGAGCGSHWPLCNGEVVPRSPGIETLIELTHRVTSGIALLMVVALAVLANLFDVLQVLQRLIRSRKASTALDLIGRLNSKLMGWATHWRPRGHATRKAAAWTLFFMLTEAGVGAGLVLFELVADNQSMARALFMSTHLINTFFLLGAMTLTAHFASGRAPFCLRGQGSLAGWLVTGAVALLLAGVSGAIAALGDTLFPAATLSEALRQDLSPTAHLLIRLRILHPALSVAAAALAIFLAFRLESLQPGSLAARWANRWTLRLVFLQIVAGVVNVLLLAPVWMQLVHLLLADLVWISYIVVGAQALAGARGVRGVEALTPGPSPASGRGV